MSVRYKSGPVDVSFVTSVQTVGGGRLVTGRLFGMALQVDAPMILTQLGQFDPEDRNHGIYVLSVIRAEDDQVVATTELDMGQTRSDALGFKYARLPETVQLDATARAVTIYPRGLAPTEKYEVRGSNSKIHLKRVWFHAYVGWNYAEQSSRRGNDLPESPALSGIRDGPCRAHRTIPGN